MMLDPRKNEILGIIISEYIKTGEPTASKKVGESSLLGISSATARNEMSALAEMGLLMQPHSSSGRVPSSSGIYYYIENIMPKTEISKEEKTKINSIFKDKQREMERGAEALVKAATETLAALTGVAGLATTPESEKTQHGTAEFMRVSEILLLVLLINEAGLALHELTKLDKSAAAEDLSRFGKKVNEVLGKKPLERLSPRDFRELGEDFALFYPVIELICGLARKAAGGDLFLAGEMNLFVRSDFSTDAKGLAAFLGDERLRGLVAENTSARIVYINKDSATEAEAPEIAIVTESYYGGGTNTGRIGIAGPVRIDYEKVIPLVRYFAGMTSKLMEEFLIEDEEKRDVSGKEKR